VEAAGTAVRKFRPGDDVFALLCEGGFAEYVSVRQDLLAREPANLSHDLVNGASGSVGTVAVQLATAFGTLVTGVCSAKNADLVRSLGEGCHRLPRGGHHPPLAAESAGDHADRTHRGRKVTPVIDRRAPFADISTAVGYQQKGHAAGKVALTFPSQD
jgi:hypothetical protein